MGAELCREVVSGEGIVQEKYPNAVFWIFHFLFSESWTFPIFH
jgi:hypothetical protein